jgi:hypothetical protein
LDLGLAPAEFLDLSDTPVDDSAIDSLIRMPELIGVMLSGSQVTPAGIARLHAERPELLIDR